MFSEVSSSHTVSNLLHRRHLTRAELDGMASDLSDKQGQLEETIKKQAAAGKKTAKLEEALQQLQAKARARGPPPA